MMGALISLRFGLSRIFLIGSLLWNHPRSRDDDTIVYKTPACDTTELFDELLETPKHYKDIPNTIRLTRDDMLKVKTILNTIETPVLLYGLMVRESKRGFSYLAREDDNEEDHA